jgi:hypothetical protein
MFGGESTIRKSDLKRQLSQSIKNSEDKDLAYINIRIKGMGEDTEWDEVKKAVKEEMVSAAIGSKHDVGSDTDGSGGGSKKDELVALTAKVASMESRMANPKGGRGGGARGRGPGGAQGRGPGGRGNEGRGYSGGRGYDGGRGRGEQRGGRGESRGGGGGGRAFASNGVGSAGSGRTQGSASMGTAADSSTHSASQHRRDPNQETERRGLSSREQETRQTRTMQTTTQTHQERQGRKGGDPPILTENDGEGSRTRGREE